jgi:hypothetical protein
MSTVPTLVYGPSSIDVTDKIMWRTLRWDFKTLDVRLKYPAASLGGGATPGVTQAISLDVPSWEGTIVQTNITHDERGTVRYVDISATSTNTPETGSAPFNLSDDPNGSTTFGYRNFQFRQTHTDVTTVQQEEVDLWEEGLYPGYSLWIANAAQGWEDGDVTATIVEMQVGWERPDQAVYHIVLSDPRLSLPIWYENQLPTTLAAINVRDMAGLLQTFTKAGAISDADVDGTPANGMFGFDTTHHRLYYREGGAWHYINRDA